MKRIEWQNICIDRDSKDPSKGWGWIEVKKDDIERLKISTSYPKSLEKALRKTSNRLIRIPQRTNNSGSKKFTLNLDGELIIIRAQKSLTIPAICFWVKTLAKPNAQVITAGNRSHSIDGSKSSNQSHFVYFIANDDSNAIKIGRAKDLEKRMKALQTSSPAKLRLVKSIQVNGMKEAHEMELVQGGVNSSRIKREPRV